jgi:hypothetical protein
MTTNIKRAVQADMKRADAAMKAAMTLTPGLASKIASVIVHADELFSPDGRNLDKIPLKQALNEPDVKAWIKSLGPLAPVKRLA